MVHQHPTGTSSATGNTEGTPDRFTWERALREADEATTPWYLKSFLLLIGTYMDGKTGENARPKVATIQRITGLSRGRVYGLFKEAEASGWLWSVAVPGKYTYRLPTIPSVVHRGLTDRTPTDVPRSEGSNSPDPTGHTDRTPGVQPTGPISITDQSLTNQAGRQAANEPSPAVVVETACPAQSPTEENPGEQLIRNLPIKWTVTEQVIDQCEGQANELLRTWEPHDLAAHWVDALGGREPRDAMAALTAAIKRTQPKLTAVKAPVVHDEPCGHCDARPGDPISARVVWIDLENDVYELCDCHPSRRVLAS